MSYVTFTAVVLVVFLVALALLWFAVGFMLRGEDKVTQRLRERRAARGQAASAKYDLVVDASTRWPLDGSVIEVLARVNGYVVPCELRFVGDEPYVFARDRATEADRSPA